MEAHVVLRTGTNERQLMQLREPQKQGPLHGQARMHENTVKARTERSPQKKEEPVRAHRSKQTKESTVQALTLSSHDGLCIFAGGVSPVGSRDRPLVLARICLKASWIVSNFPSTLASKVACRVSIFSKRSSKRWSLASSALLLGAAIAGATGHGLEASP